MKWDSRIGIVVIAALWLGFVGLANAQYNVGDYWQASRDWTPNNNPDDDFYGTADVWAYQYNTNDADFDPANHQNMTYWTGSEWRQSSSSTSPGRYCIITSSGGHPEDAQDMIRTWTSPVYGEVQIAGSVTNTNPNCGDGIRPYIHQGTTQLWTADLPNAGTASYDLTTYVEPGDKIAFRVNPKANQGCDGCGFNPTITYLGMDYQAGHFWRPSLDWSAQNNPDDDRYGTPGVWRYQYNTDDADFDPANHQNMTYWTGSEWRQSSSPTSPGRYAIIHASGGHPEDAQDTIRTWTSPVTGNVRISGSASNTNPGGGDGIRPYIHQETSQLWTADVGNGGSASYNFITRVQEGERIAFRVNPKANQGYDSYAFDPTITYMANVTYKAGDYWRPSEDWTGAGDVPRDPDKYGTPDVWRYQFNTDDADFNPAGHQDMTYWSGSEWRMSSNPSGTPGTGRYSLITRFGGHPDEGGDPIRTWTSPISGTVTITGSLSNTNANCGQGVRGYIHHNDTELWNELTGNGGTVNYDLTTKVRPGDALHFRINPYDSQHCDSCAFDPVITFQAPYGLIGQWDANEGTGTAFDTSGANYGSGGLPINFTNFTGGAGWTAPGVEPGVGIGRGNALRIPFGAEIRPDRSFPIAPGHNEITLEAWVKYHGSDQPDRWRQLLIDSSGAAMLFLERRGSPGDYYWGAAASTWVDIGGSLQWAQANGTTKLEPETWYQLAMTYDGAETRLYLDGELEATRTVVGTMNPGDKWLRLGLNNPGWEVDADLDFIRLWDYALTPEEIRASYFAVIPEPSAMLTLLVGLAALAGYGVIRRRRAGGP